MIGRPAFAPAISGAARIVCVLLTRRRARSCYSYFLCLLFNSSIFRPSIDHICLSSTIPLLDSIPNPTFAISP